MGWGGGGGGFCGATNRKLPLIFNPYFFLLYVSLIGKIGETYMFLLASYIIIKVINVLNLHICNTQCVLLRHIAQQFF